MKNRPFLNDDKKSSFLDDGIIVPWNDDEKSSLRDNQISS